jgi:hypothetical protein
VRCIRYMKRWRAEIFGEESAVSSILLVTMLGKHDPSIKNYYPALTNPLFSKITGVICGYRVEEIEDKLMQQIRYLDKLVDELAKEKAMDKILRK